MSNSSKDAPWSIIFDAYNIHSHDFEKAPFYISAQKIKEATSHFSKTAEREVRILCYQAQRKDQPEVFKVSPGEKVAAIGSSNVSISELSA